MCDAKFNIWINLPDISEPPSGNNPPPFMTSCGSDVSYGNKIFVLLNIYVYLV